MDHAMWLVGTGTAISNEKVGTCFCNMVAVQISHCEKKSYTQKEKGTHCESI